MMRAYSTAPKRCGSEGVSSTELDPRMPVPIGSLVASPVRRMLASISELESERSPSLHVSVDGRGRDGAAVTALSAGKSPGENAFNPYIFAAQSHKSLHPPTPPPELHVMVRRRKAAAVTLLIPNLNVLTARKSTFITHVSHVVLATCTNGPSLALATASEYVMSWLCDSCSTAIGLTAPSETTSHAGRLSVQHTCAKRRAVSYNAAAVKAAASVASLLPCPPAAARVTQRREGNAPRRQGWTKRC